MPDFLSIPGNIRQQYMPFTVSGNGKTQLFSFKPLRKADRVAIIHPFSRWTENMIAGDSGIKYTHAPGGSEKIEYNEFLDLIPSIQIREYVPDAKLTQMFKWFSYLKKGFDAGLRNIDNISFSASEVGNEVKKIMGKISKTMKELTSGDAKLLANVVAGLAHYYQDKGFNLGSDDGFAVLFLPFILYYRLTTTHTNNIYELPYSMENDIFQSDGTYGWGSSTGGADDFGLMKAGKAISDSPIGKLAQSIMGNSIKVNVMPSFQPDGEAKGDTINISFDLINDSAEAAINNFLFCHTLFGNNKWLQYGFVQAGSSVYDVKLPGANRYFMCSGEFKCKGKGVFRTPCETICQGLVNHNHATKTFANDVINSKIGGKTIKEHMVESRSENIVQSITDSASRSSKRMKRSISTSINAQMKKRTEDACTTSANAVNTTTSNGNNAQPSPSITITSKTKEAADYRSKVSEFKSWKGAQEGKAEIESNKNKIFENEVKISQLPKGNPKIEELQKEIDSLNTRNRIINEQHPKIQAEAEAQEAFNTANSYYNNAVNNCASAPGFPSPFEISEKLYDERVKEFAENTINKVKETKERLNKAENDLETAKNTKLAADNAVTEAQNALRAAVEQGADESELAMLQADLETAQDNANAALTELSLAEGAYSEISDYMNSKEYKDIAAAADIIEQQNLTKYISEYETALANAEAANIDGNTERTQEEMEAAKEKIKKIANDQAEEEMNKYVASSKVDSTYIKDLIKIPDVYSITLTFYSLIPDNFNNYLYGFRAGNLDPIKDYFNGDVDEIGAFEKLVDQLQKAMGSNS